MQELINNQNQEGLVKATKFSKEKIKTQISNVKKMSDILNDFTNGYSLHHKHIAKQCNVGKVIRYKDNNMKLVSFFIDDIKKDIVVWANNVDDPHGEAIKLDNDQIKTKPKKNINGDKHY